MLFRRPAARPFLSSSQRSVLPARIGRVLRDEDVVGAAGDRAHQREIAAVPAHHLDDEAALVAGRGAGDGVDGLDDPVQRRVGTDRHVGADHVVVDRTDQSGDHQRRVPVGGGLVDRAGRQQLGDQGRPFLAQQVGAAQAAVATDDDQPVDALEQQVVHRLAPPVAFPEFQRPGGADHGAAAVQDAADVVPADRPDPVAAIDQPW